MPIQERNIVVKTPDGVELATDIHHPDGDGPHPTLLMRTPYGKDVIGETAGIGDFVAAGYRVVLQDCRGSGASDGAGDHFAESVDGRTTGDWIAAQPWFDGNLGTWGGSYMGFTQWALASSRPPYLKAMAIGLVNSFPANNWFPGGSFALDIALPWTLVRTGKWGLTPEEQSEAEQRLNIAFNHLPLRTADEVATGESVAWWARWMDHPSADDPFWKPIDFREAIGTEVPILFIDGWYDYPARQMVREFEQRRAAGLTSRLMVGPGTHFGVGIEDNVETIAWFDQHLRAIAPEQPAPDASVYVLPDQGWRDIGSWPPAATEQVWHLADGGGLGADASAGSTPFHYDPADPTPSYGGPGLRVTECGPVDNRELEARDDVLTFTTAPLSESITTIGNGHVRLFLESDVDFLDVYVRVCDVKPNGESINITEIIQRLTPELIARDASGVCKVNLELRPVAQRFAAGHRIRLQVSGGAHPLFARNTCSGEPLADAVTLIVAHNRVHHSDAYPSALALPVMA